MLYMSIAIAYTMLLSRKNVLHLLRIGVNIIAYYTIHALIRQIDLLFPLSLHLFVRDDLYRDLSLAHHAETLAHDLFLVHRIDLYALELLLQERIRHHKRFELIFQVAVFISEFLKLGQAGQENHQQENPDSK